MASTTAHPLTALSEKEIITASNLIRTCHEPGTKLRFKGISLHEPTKQELRLFDNKGTVPPRKTWINYYLVGTPTFYEVIVNLTSRKIERSAQVPAGLHGPVDDNEILEVERLTLEDPRVKAEIDLLQLPQGSVVVCDPWIWFVHVLSSHRRMLIC
jgi:primary-amine oxidase